jgi:glycosyltransferase involved in cell wall biosynthesis
MRMNIAILGTRGVPNYYGGFEQFAAYLSKGLVEKGHQITVYNSHNHPYQGKEWHGVKIIHCKDLEYRMGTAGQFIYDLNCIIDARKRKYDIILQLGYTSSSVWGWLMPMKTTVVTTNMDGLEWKRTKYNKHVQRFLKYAETLAVKYSHHLIADSLGIQSYLRHKYSKPSLFIPYGADLFREADINFLATYRVLPFQYNMLIARMEPENNIEMILDGVVESGSEQPFLVVGKTDTPFGKHMQHKFKAYNHIRFIGGIFDMAVLNNLRYFANLYFHGHTVGGTNPSLLEAMASNSLICAHDNIFNKSILGEDAFYFKNYKGVAKLLASKDKKDHQDYLLANEGKIKHKYSWEMIVHQYLNHFEDILGMEKTAFKPSNNNEQEVMAITRKITRSS